MVVDERCARGVHHWLAESDRRVSLTPEEARLHPDCLARLATCRRCGATGKLYERLQLAGWSDR